MHHLEVVVYHGFYLLLWWKTTCAILVLPYGPDRNEAHSDFILE